LVNKLCHPFGNIAGQKYMQLFQIVYLQKKKKKKKKKKKRGRKQEEKNAHVIIK